MENSKVTINLQNILSYVIPSFLATFVAVLSLYYLFFNKTGVVGAYEHGFIEISTFIILIIGITKGLHFLFTNSNLLEKKYQLLCVFFLFGMFYFAAEEISWGQHLYNWETNEFFRAHNDQGETNFHNMSSWADQKPRLVLEICVLIFGVIIPFFLNNNSPGIKLNQFKNYFVLPKNLLFVALIAILIKVPERLNDHVFIGLIFSNIRYSEVQEMFFAYFMMLYMFTYYDNNRLMTSK